MPALPTPVLPKQIPRGPHPPAAAARVSPLLLEAAGAETDAALLKLRTSKAGLSEDEAGRRLQAHGPNVVAKDERHPRLRLLRKALINPLVILLVVLSGSSFLTGDFRAGCVILLMVVLGVVVRFVQEARADSAAAKLRAMISVHATVLRDGRSQEVPVAALVPGDVVELAAGDMIPADVRLVACKDLFVTQGSMTGESFPVEKFAARDAAGRSPLELTNVCYLGTSVESGAATAVVVATGLTTLLGGISTALMEQQVPTSFDRGMTRFTWLMIYFILVMVPLVFVINGLTKGDWAGAFFFAMAVAVGMTPEMLPMIVAVCLSKGAIAMSRKKVVVKRLNAIQNLGAMDVLCTDKTGTLTQDRIILEKHCDVTLKADDEVLALAYLNSHFQTGLKNLMDRAVLTHTEVHAHPAFPAYAKVDEVPFDFSRRLMSVVVKTPAGAHRLICKGAPEAVYARCTHFELDGEIQPVNEMIRADLKEEFDRLSADGFRVLAVAYRDLDAKPAYSKDDEKDMTLRGYVAFLDPPKDTARAAIAALQADGVAVKVLTGDNELVSRKICREVGIATDVVLTGSQVEGMSDAELAEAAGRTTLFARLSPAHKQRVIRSHQGAGHVVGFLGDGINDAPALRTADVGLSVDTAADIAKESADAILMEKDLLVLAKGVREGRKVFANILKYVRMGASSNFGNMFSVVGASIFLPFVPMTPIQILTNNLLYDFSQVAIPTDDVDPEQVAKPRPWSIGQITRYILFIGPCSSVFDYVTFFVMLYAFGCWDPARASLFQTAWFVESLLTQTLIIHVIRTNRIPFLQSWASWPLIATTVAVMAVGSSLPFSPVGPLLGFTPLPLIYWPLLAAILLGYVLLTQAVKTWLLRKDWVSGCAPARRTGAPTGGPGAGAAPAEDTHSARTVRDSPGLVRAGYNDSTNPSRTRTPAPSPTRPLGMLPDPVIPTRPTTAVHVTARATEKTVMTASIDRAAPHLLVVIDYKEARVYRTEVHGAVPVRLEPYDPHGHGRHLHSAHEWTDGKSQHERKSYYEAVAKTLRGAGQVLLFGSGTGKSSAMDQLLADLTAHHPDVAKAVVGSVVVDAHHTTENQLLARAREFYADYNRK